MYKNTIQRAYDTGFYSQNGRAENIIYLCTYISIQLGNTVHNMSRNTFHTCLTHNYSYVECLFQYPICLVETEKKKVLLQKYDIEKKKRMITKRKKSNKWKKVETERNGNYHRECKKKGTHFTENETPERLVYSFRPRTNEYRLGTAKGTFSYTHACYFFAGFIHCFTLFSLLFSFEFCGGLCCKYRCLPIYTYIYIHCNKYETSCLVLMSRLKQCKSSVLYFFTKATLLISVLRIQSMWFMLFVRKFLFTVLINAFFFFFFPYPITTTITTYQFSTNVTLHHMITTSATWSPTFSLSLKKKNKLKN